MEEMFSECNLNQNDKGLPLLVLHNTSQSFLQEAALCSPTELKFDGRKWGFLSRYVYTYSYN